MRVFITGANGFIGGHLVRAFIAAGHDVVACVRQPKVMQQRWPGISVISADFSRDHAIDDWLPRLKGIDVVINAVGIIRERHHQTFEALHSKAPCALFKACEQARVKRVIQISALGTDETAFSQYHLSKRAADEYLMQLDIDWTIVMPSIVYGPGAKSMAFFKALAVLPIVPLVGKGEQPVQLIHVDDLVRAVTQLIESDTGSKRCIEMVGPKAITIKEIYIQLRQWLGMGKASFVSIPYRLSLLGARLGGFLGDTPMSAEAIQMLRKGNTADVQSFIDQFAFVPRSFELSLDQAPAQQTDRWHAGLYFLNPLLRLAIAFLWIYSGVVSAFIYPIEQSYGLLAQVGITGSWARFMLFGAAAMDIILGLATLFVSRISLVGLIQIAVIVLYTSIITFFLPEQWLHPFGPVSKNLPIIIATLIMMVLGRR